MLHSVALGGVRFTPARGGAGAPGWGARDWVRFAKTGLNCCAGLVSVGFCCAGLGSFALTGREGGFLVKY